MMFERLRRRVCRPSEAKFSAILQKLESRWEKRLEECHAGWLRRFETKQEIDMVRMDDLMTAVTGVQDGVTRLEAEVTNLRTELAASGVEDPRVGQAADALAAMKTSLDTLVPPAPPTPPS